METKTFEICYEIKKGDSWRPDSIKIDSNLSTDPMIDCSLPKSLIDVLVKESATLEPDKMLLSLAEAQRRGIQENLEALDDMALNVKNRANKVQEKLMEVYEENDKKYCELEKRFCDTRDKFETKLKETKRSIEKNIKEMDTLSKKLLEINNYDLSHLATTLETLVKLSEKDSELVKIVLDYKSK